MLRLLMLAVVCMTGLAHAQSRAPTGLPGGAGMVPRTAPMAVTRLPPSPPVSTRSLPPPGSAALGALPPVSHADRLVGDRALRGIPAVDLRRVRIRELVRALPERVELDPAGEPVVRGEFLALDPSAEALAAIDAAGFVVEPGDTSIDGFQFGLRLVRDRQRRPATEAMRALQDAAPDTEFAYQHVYLESAAKRPPVIPPDAAGAGPGAGALTVGLIDSGVDGAHRALAGLRIERHGCNGRTVPAPHGTIVAARLAGGATGTLYAADLWCGDPVGRATLGLVEALAWMGRSQVGVINISLVGPDNAAVARAVRALQARGHIIVAAVGNDGPAAPALYPAAYPGVIGVGAVDDRRRPLPETASGPHVDYVAPGVVRTGRRPIRGTSFAAPLVARLAAEAVARPSPDAAARVQGLLEKAAVDMERHRGDPRVGAGLIATGR